MRHVHLGLGRFHRAHQALYFQNLRRPKVTAFSMRSVQEAEALASTGFSYDVLVLSGQGAETVTVDCLDEAHFALENRERLFELLSDPEVSTVTLTVTEKGYCATNQGTLDLNCPALVADTQNSSAPVSTLGLLVLGLERRRASHNNPINILSCDNIQGNGHQLERLCLEWSRAFGRDSLDEYFERCVSFPNSMVDRIVPRFCDQELERYSSFGARAKGLVVTEQFSQWVIEDRFLGGRPPWEQKGLVFSDEVTGYERMKLRLLNASHSFLAYYGQLQGHRFVHEAIVDPKIHALVEQLYAEVCPFLQPPRGVDLGEYCDQLLARFDNPHLPHQLGQIAMDGSQKIPQRILGSLFAAAEAERPHEVLRLALDSWLRYMWLGLSGRQNFPISDPLAGQMRATLGADYESTVRGWLFEEALFGQEAAAKLAALS